MGDGQAALGEGAALLLGEDDRRWRPLGELAVVGVEDEGMLEGKERRLVRLHILHARLERCGEGQLVGLEQTP